MEPKPEYFAKTTTSNLPIAWTQWIRNTTYDPVRFSSEYVPKVGGDYVSPVDEFVAWDGLSDEALAGFEKALQNAGPDLEIMGDALLLCLKIFSKLVLPRLAALESRLPVRLPLEMLPQPVRWDGIP